MYQYNLGIRFESVAAEHADRPALCCSEHEIISYAQLNKLANKFARLFLQQGVTARDVVCLSGEKSLFTFASMVACLKIGAIYSTLDPDSPIERLRKILSTCEPKLLLAPQHMCDKLTSNAPDSGIKFLQSDTNEISGALEKVSDSNLPETSSITATNPAYIMFTSGSTGIPKGAVMTHANVLNLIEWSKDTFSITAYDVLTNVNSLYFDNSVFDFYSALFTGARLVSFSKAEVKDPKRLVEKVEAFSCTLWFSVPSLLIFLQTMRAADGKHLKSIRRFIFGGEGYPKAKLKSLYQAYADTSEIFNVYGPTECTCICSSYRITDSDFGDLNGFPALGSIARNFSFLVLDDRGNSLQPGEIGELCLLGPNVGKGYYNDKERTQASFVANPFNQAFTEIMYKTGDLVRLDPADGKLYIHGRKDNQIKHMGYRIELEEIEIAMNRLDYVSEAVVLHTSANGLSRLVGIVSVRQLMDENRIRLDLKEIIPDYMIPSVFHQEDSLPKNANGKIDRRYLTEKYLKLD